MYDVISSRNNLSRHALALGALLLWGCGGSSALLPDGAVKDGAADVAIDAPAELRPEVAPSEAQPETGGLEAANSDSGPGIDTDAGDAAGSAGDTADVIPVPDVPPDVAEAPLEVPPEVAIEVPPEVLEVPPDVPDGLGSDVDTGSGSGPPTANLQLWLRGDLGVDCIPVGDKNRVAEWRDQSPHQRHARPPAGKRGPLCGPSAGVINGRSTIGFPRTPASNQQQPARQDEEDNEYLEVDLHALANKPYSIAVVERRSGTDFSSWIIGAKLPFPDALDCFVDVFDPKENPNKGKGLMLGYPMSATITATTWGPDCDATYTGVVVGSKAHTTVLVYAPATGLTLFLDGVQKATAPAPALVQIEALIGRGFYQGPDSRYKGEIAEILAFDTALSVEDRQKLESYLHQSWDTTIP